MSDNITFWEHLEDMRWAIIRIIGVILLFFIAAFTFVPQIFDRFILAAVNNNGILNILGNDIIPKKTTDINIININIATQFITHISTSFWIAVTATFPYIIYETWRFIKPALYKKEEKDVRFAFTLGTIMFYAGCATGYCIIFPLTFRFLALYRLSETVSNSISLESYMSTFLTMIFTMGIMFEMPLLTWLLSKMGIIGKLEFAHYRRHAVVILLILAAVITPTGDPFTMLAVFTPLYILYEFGILISRK